MSDKRFVLDKLYYPIMTPIEKISVGRNYMTYGEVVDLLNNLHQENQELKKKNNALKEDINQSEKRVKHWMMLYEDVYDKMQKRRVSG